MAIADDFSVAANGDIRYTGSTANYTVIELHRFLQDLADDAVAGGNDLLDITDNTPSDRSTDNIITLINGYNIDDTAAEHLYDGSITQAGGDTVYSGLVVVGAVPAGTNLQIVQANSLLTNYWGTGLNADAGANILLRIMVKTRVDGANIDGQRLRVQARELGDTYAEFLLTAGLGNATAAIFTASDLNNQTAAGTIATWSSITNTEGLNLLDVTGDAVNEEYYSQWDLGTQTINDLYERTKWIQRRATAETIHGMNGELFRGITHNWAYDAETGAGPATNDTFSWGLLVTYSGLTGGPFVVGEVVTFSGGAYGRVLSVDGTNLTLVVSIESGAPLTTETITGVTSSATATVNGAPVGQSSGGGTAAILAVNDGGTTGSVYVQLLKGTTPADNAVLYEDTGHTSTLTVNGSVTSRTVSPAFIGQSTGSAIIGAYGIGIQPADLTASDLLFDLTNTPRNPPNNVTFTVNGLIHDQDRVLVGPESAGALNVAQFTVATTALTTANITSVEVSSAIPSDTPSAGTIRVFDNDGVARRLEYTSWSGSTFTIDPTASEAHDATTATVADFNVVNANIGNNVFISYIDELAQGSLVSAGSFVNGVSYVIASVGTTDFTLIGAASNTVGLTFTATGVGTGTGTAYTSAATATFTAVYLSNRSLFIRVRDGGATPIRTFETTGTLGSAGGSSTAIRTSDA